MDLIDGFIARYTKEVDFYTEAARRVSSALETELRGAGVRCIVTYRAKSIVRLEDKCRQRMPEKNYVSVDAIYEDIVDLAGVRVALYFPSEQDEVDRVVSRLFVLEKKKRFPRDEKEAGFEPDVTGDSRSEQAFYQNRFPGYSAVHYRARLRESNLNEPDKRYATARVEIQVASVLMHAWAEVEHDLVYKPLEGLLSDSELSFLDQLNGLVHSGEIALEGLQKAGELRVAETGRRFLNHYELAAYLLGRPAVSSDEPITDSGVGRVDILFALLEGLEIASPKQLDPYLEALHGNLEERPLADQVIDALLAEDPDRYSTYSRLKVVADQDTRYRLVGEYLTIWARLENLIRNAARADDGQRALLPRSTELVSRGLLDKEWRGVFDFARDIRNSIVHTGEVPSSEALSNIIALVNDLVAEIEHRVATTK